MPQRFPTSLLSSSTLAARYWSYASGLESSTADDVGGSSGLPDLLGGVRLNLAHHVGVVATTLVTDLRKRISPAVSRHLAITAQSSYSMVSAIR